MRCPKCSCEAGNQSICPFCGTTIYLSAPTWSNNDYVQRTTIPVGKKRTQARRPEPDRRLKNLETKVDMLLVLQCGTFALTLLTLICMILN